MTRCSSWKPRPDAGPGHDNHAPGTCRKCWTLCRHKVERGQFRCMECNLALARHPSGQVRAQLATEGEHVPHDVLELLVCDLDATVAQAASHAMASRTSSTDLLDLLDAAPSHPAAPRPAAPTNEAPPAGTPAAPSETREGI